MENRASVNSQRNNFIKLMRSDHNYESLTRVCQHLSLLVTMQNKSMGGFKSRNEQQDHYYGLYPPNNTPAEILPKLIQIDRKRARQNWQRIGWTILIAIRVINTLRAFKHNSNSIENILNELINDCVHDNSRAVTTPIDKKRAQKNWRRTISKVLTRIRIFNLFNEYKSDCDLINSWYGPCFSSVSLMGRPSELKTLSNDSKFVAFEQSCGPNQEESSSLSSQSEASPSIAPSKWLFIKNTMKSLIRSSKDSIFKLIKSPDEARASSATSLGSVLLLQKSSDFSVFTASGNYTTKQSHSSCDTVNRKASK